MLICRSMKTDKLKPRPTCSHATQVGNYTIDQIYWGRPEDIPMTQGGFPTRPAFTVPATHASDLGGAIVAALAASSLVFHDADPGYSNTLLSAAFDLYAVVTDSANHGLCVAPCNLVKRSLPASSAESLSCMVISDSYAVATDLARHSCASLFTFIRRGADTLVGMSLLRIR